MPTTASSATLFNEGLVGCDSGLRPVLERVDRVLGKSVHVLIEGESGKELIAKLLHDRDPLRHRHPFVSLNCAAIPEALLEAELFGYRRGSFSGAVCSHDGLFLQANRGTLFLDEIGELSPSLQPKLLRAIQEKTIRPLGAKLEHKLDVRILSATNVDLFQAMATGRFRAELYYRLAEFTINLPPLRERKQDIRPLARHFLSAFSKKFGKSLVPQLTSDSARHLLDHDWGRNNIRELSHLLKQAVLLADGPCIEPTHLRFDRHDRHPLRTRLQQIERGSLEEAMTHTNGNIAAAARMLGMSRSTLFDRLRKLGLERSSPLASG